MIEKQALICLSTFDGFGPAREELLLEYFGSAKAVWEAPAETLSLVGLQSGLIGAFLRHRERFNPESYFKELKRLGVKTISYRDNDYPANLKGLSDAPKLLYLKGKILKSDRRSIAIVGSRRMSEYGQKAAFYFASELSRRGITVISGLARGIDSRVHKTVLQTGGRTLAVLGHGLERIYPPENKSLAEEICKKGAVLTEYPLGHPIRPYNFVARNRIVSGLSKGILVIEGAQKSGTLLTASRAAEQGRPVFAVPGDIFSVQSEATFFLIKNGAKPVAKIDDILEEFDL